MSGDYDSDRNTDDKDEGKDPRVIDFSAVKKKDKKAPDSKSFFKQKDWNITYKNESWGSGNGDKVGRSSRGNAGYQSGRDKVPFFNFSKIPVFTRLMAIAFVIVHVVLAFIVPDDAVTKVYTVFSFIPAVFTGQDGATPLLSLLSPMTYMFLHADWMHLVFNTLMMVVFSTLIERGYGARVAAFFFFGGGIAGALMFWALNIDGAWPLMGASAGISALFGATLLYLNDAVPMAGKRPSVAVMIIIWIAIMVVTGVMGGGHVAWPSHIAGFLAGLGLYAAVQRGYVRF